ncbi:hypothetical protein HPP92_008481 [Vanilla planifolia]|uniref:Uncharacterized protein n=1 Tax=Vanilla planifolia TaxID=51239 RepID=A0A835V7Y3_VANPL|nr:hypothetical protein HPP92_008481 [Vanilla planifolia]
MMGPRLCLCFFAEALLLLSLAASSAGGNASAAVQLDLLIRNRAFRAIPLYRAGRPYYIQLPAKFSVIEASAMRLRGADLWLRGATHGSFRLPPGIFTGPYAKRAILVFQDLGNLSSTYYNVPGYVLIAPVVGCLAYDASNVSLGGVVSAIKELGLRPSRDPISITFSTFAMPEGADSSKAVRCVKFGRNGSVYFGGDAAAGMTCKATGTGHFSVVLPLLAPVPAPALAPVIAAKETRSRYWRPWWVAVAVVAVICGAVVVALAVAGAMRLVRNRKMEEMEKRAEEGEVLESVWIGASKMPSAAISRTRPTIESESLPWSSVT